MAYAHPQDGDLVLRYRQRREAFFVLSVWGNGTQETTCVTYNEAFNLAKKSAESNNSDVWYTDDDMKFDLVLTFRVTA